MTATKIKMTTTHSDGSTVTFKAAIVATNIANRAPWVEIPARVRNLPFPPFRGKRFVLINPEYARHWAS